MLDGSALAQRYGGAVAVIAGDRRLTFRDLEQETERAAARLTRLGLQRGDAIALWLPNVPEWLILLLGAARVGVLVVALNTRFRSSELKQILRTTRASAVALAPGFLEIDFEGLLAEVAPELPDLRHVIRIDLRGGFIAFDVASGQKCPAVGGPSDLVCAFSTSGTTGNAKIAVHDQGSVVEHSAHVAHAFEFAPGDALLAALPLCGVFGFNSALGALAAGAACVLQPVFDATEAGRFMAKHQVTHVFGSEAMLQAMLDLPDLEAPAWRRGGAANFANLARDVIERAERRCGARLSGLYGSSECFALMARWPPDAELPTRALSGGVPVSSRIAVRVVDPETGSRLAHDQPGELQVRGYNVMAGYLGNAEATAAAFTSDGWFRTGDLGATREQGFLFMSRLRDSLRLRGYLVDPAEIEEYLAGHGAVAGAQVVGVPRPGRGDVAVAFVRRGPRGTASEAELLKACRRDLASYKVPERIVLVDDFLMTCGPNGAKVQKVALRSMAEALLNQRP